MKLLEIEHSLDHDGQKIVTIALTNSDLKVAMYEHSLNELETVGIPLAWRLVQGDVCLRGDKKVRVARLVRKAGKGDIVRFRDGCRTNLKTDNLTLSNSRDLASETVSIRHTNQHVEHTTVEHRQARPVQAGVGMP
jgi:hypothetical protein